MLVRHGLSAEPSLSRCREKLNGEYASSVHARLIEYTLGSVADGVFDLCAAFQGSTKVDFLSLQLVCLSQGLSFCDVYRKLVISSGLGRPWPGHGVERYQHGGADNALRELAVQCLEFRGVEVQSKTSSLVIKYLILDYHIWRKKQP